MLPVAARTASETILAVRGSTTVLCPTDDAEESCDLIGEGALDLILSVNYVTVQAQAQALFLPIPPVP